MNYPDWLLWLGGTLPPLGLLWLLWRLVLRPERCYHYNRALLLLAPVVAAALPLLPGLALPAWPSSTVATGATPGVAAAALLPVAQLGQAVAAPAPGWQWLLGLYALGIALGISRLVWQVARLWRLAGRWPREVHPDYLLVYTGGQLPTSSFGQVVFWNEITGLSSAEADAVLTHELTHARQHHTADVLWLEIWRVVLWPNPFAHLLLPALRLTHELLADQAATAASSPVPYAALLARLATRHVASPPAWPLLQPFLFSSTLTRIAMLHQALPVRRWKQWLVLPLLGIVAFVPGHVALAQTTQPPAAPSSVGSDDQVAYVRRLTREATRRDSLRGPLSADSMREVMVSYPEPNKPNSTYKVRVVRVRKGEWMRPNGTLEVRPWPPGGTSFEAAETPGKEKVYTYVEQMPQLPGGGGQQAIVQAIQRGLKYPVGKVKAGQVFARFIVDSKGVVQHTEIVKGLSAACDQAVLAAIKQLPQFVPGKQNGRAVAVSFTVPIDFKSKP
ncbi:TonB family protein [Hymenobacter sp. RP-2-7]|uniref:TonB family protein n=1 Tax=Hymenobacter polaris TaxID=2682546 RepID=A0A7Y0AF28_9BACT|nr:M56 family metallopeptidase [Hymenobacter polaris]NML66144.1 TonB family protein [Hymenobacter polaris]